MILNVIYVRPMVEWVARSILIIKNRFRSSMIFPALLNDVAPEKFEDGLLYAESESGICKVVCFSPDHSLTLPLMTKEEIKDVITLWQQEYEELGAVKGINHVQIFENKGDVMGCSNPHPHGQIWAQRSIPQEIQKKSDRLLAYWKKKERSILEDYIDQELKLDERIILENDHFVTLVPYWAVWPYETMIVPEKKNRAYWGTVIR